jgi:hypothetical protein
MHHAGNLLAAKVPTRFVRIALAPASYTLVRDVAADIDAVDRHDLGKSQPKAQVGI